MRSSRSAHASPSGRRSNRLEPAYAEAALVGIIATPSPTSTIRQTASKLLTDTLTFSGNFSAAARWLACLSLNVSGKRLQIRFDPSAAGQDEATRFSNRDASRGSNEQGGTESALQIGNSAAQRRSRYVLFLGRTGQRTLARCCEK